MAVDNGLQEFLKIHKNFYEDGVKHRTGVDPVLSRTIRFASPSLEIMQEKDLQKSDKENKMRMTDDLWDSTLTQAFSEYIDTQKSRMFPTTNRWFKATINPIASALGLDEELTDDDKIAIQKIVSITWDSMKLSNFEFVIEQILRDFNISTAVTKISFTGDRFNPLVFETFPYTVYALGEPDQDGRINRVFVERNKMTANAIKRAFPFVKWVTQQDEFDNPDALVIGKDSYDLIEFIVPTGEKTTTRSGKVSNWFEYYLVDKNFTKILASELYPYNPFVISRISSTNDGSRYGKGRITSILPTFITLNQLVKSETESTMWDANPAQAVVLGGVSAQMYRDNEIQFEAGKATPLPESSTVIPILSGLDIGQTRVKIQDFRRQIYDALATRPLGTFEDTKYKTAQEMYQREKENEGVLTSRYAMTIQQVSDPIVKTCMSVLEYYDVFNFPKNFDVYMMEYENPVTENYKINEIQKVIATIQILRSIYGENLPLMITNDEVLLRKVLDATNVDREVILPEDEIRQRIYVALQNLADMQAQAMVSQAGGKNG